MKTKLTILALITTTLTLIATPAHAQCGQASWYGPGFHGNLTANGEVFNQNALTAAHPSLPFGTRVRVTWNNRSVDVRINDRGPLLEDVSSISLRQQLHDLGCET